MLLFSVSASVTGFSAPSEEFVGKKQLDHKSTISFSLYATHFPKNGGGFIGVIMLGEHEKNL